MNNATVTQKLSYQAMLLLKQTAFCASVVDVDPVLAAELLTRNKANRHLNSKKVQEYAEFMLRGKWRMNGEPVIISDAGILRNGQHRLNVVIMFGGTVKMLFVCGVEDSTYTTLDTGKKRTAGDVLAIEEYKGATVIAGGIREYLALKAGIPGTNYLNATKTVSPDEVFAIAQEKGKEYCERLAQQASAYYSQSRLYSPSLTLGFILMLEEIHPTKRMPFMDKVFNGTGLEVSTPEYALSSALRKNQLAVRKMPLAITRAWFIKAFNNYLLGKKQQQVQFNPEKEKFPKFIGQ